MSKSGHLYSEQELIKGCKQNDNVCQQIVYERYFSKMMGICLRYAGNRDSAKDIVHEGFIRIFLNIEKFRAESSLETWMSRIMVNCAVDMMRKESRNVLYRSSDVTEMNIEDEDVSTETDESEKTVLTLDSSEVIELMQDLPDGYRTVLNLYAVEHFSHKEIASKLGISEGTSKSQLAKARAYLKKLILKKKQLTNESQTSLR